MHVLWVDQIEIKKAKKGYKLIYNQLKKWGLNFHKLELGKPSFDVYVDDKNFNFKKIGFRCRV